MENRNKKMATIAIRTIKNEIENQGVETQNIELKYENELERWYFKVKVKVGHKAVEYFRENMSNIITEVVTKYKLKNRTMVPFVYFKYISNI
jgi:hypothetical protein